MPGRRPVALISICTLIMMTVLACTQPAPIMRADAESTAETTGEPTAGSQSATSAPILPGGVWTRVAASDALILNPILGSDRASNAINAMLFPALIDIDPFTGAIAQNGAMAERWDVSDDGLVWTFHLRDGVTWSDGHAVDADDLKFTFDALASDDVESPRKKSARGIQSIEVVDPLTAVVTFGEVKCDALQDLGLRWLPSHLYAADFSDIMENELNDAPTTSAGPFVFQSWERGDHLILVRNDSYWQGAPYMDGMIFKVAPDPGARLSQLQSGEVDYVELLPEQVAAVEAAPNLLRHSFESDGYTHIALNLANPDMPQPGQDEAGVLVEQEPHPILGDLAVRQAIAHALDYASIIDTVFLGQGYPLAANVLPTVEWAFDPSIEPYATDPELAAALLEEAGWVDADDDGVREKDGLPLRLELATNADNTARENLGLLVQQQLSRVGFDIVLKPVTFAALTEQLLDQTYDMAIMGWNGLGADPAGDASLWHSHFDAPGSGFNYVSYQNPVVDELLDAGNSVPGCAPADRAPFYKQIQQIIHDDIPYIFVAGDILNLGVNDRWRGLNPGPWDFYNDVHLWHDATLQP